jgi:cellulose synthase/poly-beta-1,6-N-acetylglucosamine synthase-like glycosyltransferase
VVVSERRGRGHALVRGAKEAGGDIVLFLHSDTILPSGWDREFRGILEDDRVVGGGFSLSFDSPDIKMRALAMLSDLWLRMTGHVWGDRAMFVRAEALRDAVGAMDVPIFEDVRLSQQMRGMGMVVISPLKVVTSGEAFRRNGVLRQLWTIVKCHYWYIIGWDPVMIFERYYR